MDKNTPVPYDRFFRVYTVHYLETHATSDLILQIGVAALRYGMAAWRSTGGGTQRTLEGEVIDPGLDPAEQVRSAVYPRWRALLDEPDPFAPLGLKWDEYLRLRAGRPELERYRERRGLDTSLPRYLERQAGAPVIHIPVCASTPDLPAAGERRLEVRLAQAQRVLEVVDTLIRTLGTLAGFVNEWRERRKRRELLDVQRQLLQEALSKTLAGAEEALKLSKEPGFVAGYLAEHAEDQEVI